jgi:hypothetical protein
LSPTDDYLLITGNRLVTVNRYWDRVEKVIIFIVDAGLNYYFLTIVRRRLVEYHGLKKYEVLIRFNARIMVVSLALDVSLLPLNRTT